MADALRRGFKSEAEVIALEIRKELALRADERLNCADLAALLTVPVRPFTDLQAWGASSGAITALAASTSDVSAFTVFRGSKKAIFFNPWQPRGRAANSLAHELSHIVLEHEPQIALTSEGNRNWNAVQEEEATWMAATALVPRDGAYSWIRRARSTTGGAEHFGVSEELWRWRINQTGLARQLRVG